MKYQDSTGQVNDLVSGTPDSLLCLDNGNQTISSGYESSECGSTTTNSKVQSKNVIEIECNHNTVLTEENLTRFMQQVEQIRLDSGSDQLSESYSNSLIEIKNHSLRSSSDSDKLSFGTVSDLTYSDDDEGLSSTSCELPLSPGSHLYPHGIINPNYPGFQHLAHTLSEDYSTHASNCNLSDCGMYQNRNSTSDDNGNVQETENSPPSPISDSIISSTKDFNNYDHKNLLEQCNLQTYLNHYRNKSDVKMFEEEFEKSNLTPPDILFFKGCDNETQKESVITDEKPDLIQNVYQQENYMNVKLNEFNHDDDDDFMCDEIPNNSLTSNIVGDFEKEIEKEIVEIVSGYKDIFGDRTSGNYQKPHTTTPVKDEITQINHQPISAYNKIHDAKLSNGREALTPNFEMKPIKMPVPMMVKRAEVKQLTMTTHNMNKSEIQSNLNNNNNNNYYYNTTLNGTLMQHNRAVNHTINYNNNVYSNLQQQQQPNKEKHHYNCNFFNALSTRKPDTRNTKTSFLSSNSTGKTIIKTKDECGIISIEAPSSIFDFSVIEKKLNSVIREKDEKKRINNHEEIRRRLQMVEENGTLKSLLNKGKANNRPSLHSRLQNGKNLQICFMNENISDGESPSSDSESCPKLSERSKKMGYEIGQSNLMTEAENDFFTHQAKLQIEARMALAQAKDMAHLQMELEKQKTQCPVTQIIHTALNKASIHMPEGKRRVSRQLLTEFTVPQLRIIVNELNGNIEKLNEHLVQILMERDELHMGQDSMLVDIEDLTRYLAAKETPVSQYPAEETIAEKKFKSTATNHTKIDTNSNGTSSRFFRLSSFGKH